MQLGLRLMEKTSQQNIRLRWWAWKDEEENQEKEDLVGDVQVSITPNTVDVEPLQQVRFTAMVEGSASQEVTWVGWPRRTAAASTAMVFIPHRPPKGSLRSGPRAPSMASTRPAPMWWCANCKKPNPRKGD